MSTENKTVPGTVERPEGASPRIVAVDDQRDSLRLLELSLRRFGWGCVSFSSATEALGYLQGNPVDLVILDFVMPEMSGLDLCRALKADPRTADVPVLFLTANTGVDDKVRALGAGGHDYLSKPVDPQELMARTRAALRVKQLQDELKEQLHWQRRIHRLHQDMLGDHWEKTLGQLATSLAHEINNPLAVALGSVQLLALDGGLTEDVQKRLQTVDDSLQRAARKLRSLLLIAQTNREAQRVKLAVLLEDLLVLVNYRVIMQRVEVQLLCPPACDVFAVPSELARVFLGVLDNALEAVVGCTGARVRILVEPSGSAGEPGGALDPLGYEVRVGDTGGGIAAEVQARLFEPFFTTKPPPHSGVGLYLARELLRGMEGDIALVTPKPGWATEFSIKLPAVATRLNSGQRGQG